MKTCKIEAMIFRNFIIFKKYPMLLLPEFNVSVKMKVNFIVPHWRRNMRLNLPHH